MEAGDTMHQFYSDIFQRVGGVWRGGEERERREGRRGEERKGGEGEGGRGGEEEERRGGGEERRKGGEDKGKDGLFIFLPYRSRMERPGRSLPTSMLYCRRCYKANILHWRRGTIYTAHGMSCDTI